MPAADEVPEREPRRSYAALVLGVALAVLAADVVTKQWAIERLADHPVSLLNGWLTLTKSGNPGAAFGLGTSVTPLLTVLAATVVIGAAIYAFRVRSPRTAIVLALVLGGAAGNLVDRLLRPPGVMRGHVVDWIDVGAWPTFNLADSSLVVASVLMCIFAVTANKPA